MESTKPRSKRTLITVVVVAVVAIAIGVGLWLWLSDSDLRGSERDRVSAAALKAVGGGTVTSAESSDDPGVAYEVEVRRPDGTEVDLTMDKDLNVITQDSDGPDSDGRRQFDDDRGIDDPDDTPESDSPDVFDPDTDDRPLTSAERASAEKAALAAIGGGTVIDVDRSDDRGEAYEVEVRKPDNTEWKVELDRDFKVLRTARED